MILLLTLLSGAGTISAQAPGAGVLKLLPGPPIADGWVPEGEAQEFRGDDLFVYIDGGAEIYHEYGFAAVAVQDYKNPSGKSVSLEIFEMADEAAAYGMYTFKTTGKGAPVGLGDGGELEEYYLNFYKGRYVLTLTGFDGSAETIAGLRTVAGAADALLRVPKGMLPALVEILPAAPGSEAKPENVKYVRGRIGLNNILPEASGGRIFLREAVRASYGPGKLAVIDCGDDSKAKEAFTALSASLKGQGGGHGHVRAALFQSMILVTTGLPDTESETLMKGARSRFGRSTEAPA